MLTEYVATRWYRAPEVMLNAKVDLLVKLDFCSYIACRVTPKLSTSGVWAAFLVK